MGFETVRDEVDSEAIKTMKQRLSGIETEEMRRKGLALVTQPSDVFVVTTPKAGTTWMQQIVHHLRCRKAGVPAEQASAFEEISCVVPFIEMAYDVGVDLLAEQVALPRLFKTHCWYDHCPKGARYVWVVRDPMDVSLSFYKFFEGWLFEPDHVQLDEFIQQFILGRGRPQNDMENASYWDHLTSWWPHRDDPNVLLVFFEDLKTDLEGCVRRIAAFMDQGGVAAGAFGNSAASSAPATDEESIAEVVRLASFEYMSEHAHQFDEHLLKRARNPHMGLPPDAGIGQSKVRQGISGGGKAAISTQVQEQLAARWTKDVAAVTGCATYTELRNAHGLAAQARR